MNIVQPIPILNKEVVKTMFTKSAPPWVVQREEKLIFDGQQWQQDEIYFIQIFGAMVSSGLLVTIKGNGLKILIALSLAASPLGVGSPQAEVFFDDLCTKGIVRSEDRGRLFCYLAHDELCARTGLSKNTVTAHAKGLIRAGLIEQRTIEKGAIEYNIY
jgi:hypothetical protein